MTKLSVNSGPITLCNNALHRLYLDRFIKMNPSILLRLDSPQLKFECLNCQKYGIRTNSRCCSVLLKTSFCFLQVNQQKHVGMVSTNNKTFS